MDLFLNAALLLTNTLSLFCPCFSRRRMSAWVQKTMHQDGSFHHLISNSPSFVHFWGACMVVLWFAAGRPSGANGAAGGAAGWATASGASARSGGVAAQQRRPIWRQQPHQRQSQQQQQQQQQWVLASIHAHGHCHGNSGFKQDRLHVDAADFHEILPSQVRASTIVFPRHSAPILDFQHSIAGVGFGCLCFFGRFLNKLFTGK